MLDLSQRATGHRLSVNRRFWDSPIRLVLVTNPRGLRQLRCELVADNGWLASGAIPRQGSAAASGSIPNPRRNCATGLHACLGRRCFLVAGSTRPGRTAEEPRHTRGGRRLWGNAPLHDPPAWQPAQSGPDQLAKEHAAAGGCECVVLRRPRRTREAGPPLATLLASGLPAARQAARVAVTVSS